MMLRRIGLYCILVGTVALCSGGIATVPLLVFTNYDSGESGTHLQHLNTVSVGDAKPGIPAELLSLPVPTNASKSAARFDLGRNHIHNNRWLITANGDIFDLTLKKLVLQTRDRFIRAGSDSLIFYTNDIIRGKYYSVFSEKTGTYTQVTKPGWKAITGRDAEADCTTLPFHIYEYHPSAPKTELVADAGSGENLSLRPNEKPSCPLFWLNNNQLLFPKYTNGGQTLSIMLVNAASGNVSEIGRLEEVQPSRTAFRFLKGENAQLLFHCGKGWYVVNTVAGSISPENKLDVGFGFSVGLDAYPLQGNPVLYRGQTIGTYFCDPEAVYTAEGRIAFCADQLIGGERFRKGIAIWTTTAGSWKWVSDGDAAAVCGWIN
ncbi:MAG: hypothetical protein ACK5Z2_00670 [Bacteroidota bacterium]|jgi:hypothetical protein